MTQIIVRNLDDDVRDGLLDRAQRNGHSIEDEVRDILRDAVKGEASAGPEKLGSWMREQFAECQLEEGESIPEWRVGA